MSGFFDRHSLHGTVFSGCRSTPPADDPSANDLPVPPGDLDVVEVKTGQYDAIEVAPGFLLYCNMWATIAGTKQEIRVYEDGSYGWGWRRGNSGVNDPNYPEVFYGVKPWGTGVDDKTLLLPKQLKDISSLQMELDFDYEITNKTGW